LKGEAATVLVAKRYAVLKKDSNIEH